MVWHSFRTPLLIDPVLDLCRRTQLIPLWILRKATGWRLLRIEPETASCLFAKDTPTGVRCADSFARTGLTDRGDSELATQTRHRRRKTQLPNRSDQPAHRAPICGHLQVESPHMGEDIDGPMVIPDSAAGNVVGMESFMHTKDRFFRASPQESATGERPAPGWPLAGR